MGLTEFSAISSCSFSLEIKADLPVLSKLTSLLAELSDVEYDVDPDDYIGVIESDEPRSKHLFDMVYEDYYFLAHCVNLLQIYIIVVVLYI